MTEHLVFACALSGVALMLLAAVGLLRLPDALCRAHAAAKATALGIALVLCAVWLDLGSGAAGFKVALAILFQLATIPVASHLLARVALHADVPLYRGEPPADADPGTPGRSGRRTD
ncbi:MAG: monovalent cation/H(+) antiporter subunit G [Limisphaerales bacterium]